MRESLPSTTRFNMRWIAVLTLSVVMVFRAAAAQNSLKDHLGPFASSEPSGITSADIEEIATIIQQSGISVNLDPFCSSAELDHVLDDCQFRQLTVLLKNVDTQLLVFNVPRTLKPAPFAVVFHFGRGLGEIYLVSMSGNLIRAYIQTAGGPFELNETGEAKQKFLIDMAYWARNIGQIYDAFGIARPKNRQ